MIHDGGDQFPSVPSNLHVYVPDVNVTYGRLQAGGVSVQEPHKTEANGELGEETLEETRGGLQLRSINGAVLTQIEFVEP